MSLRPEATILVDISSTTISATLYTDVQSRQRGLLSLHKPTLNHNTGKRNRAIFTRVVGVLSVVVIATDHMRTLRCNASIEVESPEEVQKRHDRLEEHRIASEASALGVPPEGALKTLSEDEQRELVDSALAGISYFSDWRFGLGNRLYYEDLAPKMLAPLGSGGRARFQGFPTAAHGKYRRDSLDRLPSR